MTCYTTRVFGAAMTLLIALSAQTPPQEFAVASVRPNHVGTAGGEGSEREKITVSPVSLIMRNVSLRSCVRWAYDLRDSQISAPGWMATERYDIAANPPGPASPAEMRVMMQQLLAERFKLLARRETKDLPVYTMTLKKTGKLKPPSGETTSMRPTGGAIEFRSYSMTELAEQLASRPFKLDRLVVDKTGLTGFYDFNVKFTDNPSELKHTLEGMEQGNADGSPSMITILQEQLGLAFKANKAPVSSLIVDHAERVPTNN